MSDPASLFGGRFGWDWASLNRLARSSFLGALVMSGRALVGYLFKAVGTALGLALRVKAIFCYFTCFSNCT